MKKIVFLIGGLNYGGMERVVFIAANLIKENFDVTISTLYQTNPDYELNHKQYNINVPPKKEKIFSGIIFIKRLLGVRKMKKKLKPDYVFSFGMYPNYLNALTKNKEKIIMGIRSYDWLNKPFINTSLDKWIVKKFDSINSVSKMIANDAQFYWNINAENNRVIYNPYNVEYIESKSLEIIDDFFFTENIFYFISTGRLSNQKGYQYLIRAFQYLHSNYPKTCLLILGNGELKDELNDLIDECALKDCVYLLGGKSNPHKYVKKCDCYILSSLNEGFPNALVEAMCVETPVLATNCKSGPSEILFKHYDRKLKCDDIIVGDYGILTKEINPLDSKNIDDSIKSLVKGMKFEIENKDICMKLAKRGKKSVSNFSYETFKNNLILEIDNA